MKNIRVLVFFALTLLLSFSLFACSSNSLREEETTVETSSVSIEQTTSSESNAYSQSSEESIYSEVSSQTVINSEESPEQISEKSVQEQTYTVTIQSASVYGDVTASKTSDIQSGTTVTFNVSANAYCKLDYLKVNGVDIVVNNNVATYVVTQNCVVTYSFSQIKYSINCYPSSNGTITTSPVNNAVYGANVTVTVTPNQNYTVGTLTLSYGSTTRQLNLSGNTATFTMPAESVILSATYNVQTYNIICLASANGTITTSPENSAISGAQITVTATPNTDYVLEKIVLSYGGNDYNLSLTGNSATFTMPESNVTLSATFTVNDNREYVSHMVLGDSYTDTYFWQDFYSDMSILPRAKTLGIGATQSTVWMDGLTKDVEFWGLKKLSITTNYNVSNFIFHVGINDITIGGENATTTISRLKTMFSMYHEAYPNANIYWVSLSWITQHNAEQLNTCRTVNDTIRQYASTLSYLNYIDTTSVMFPEGVTNPDWFIDGTHFNPDGYATWSNLILQALGYTRDKVSSFGNGGLYYTSSTFTDNGNGTVGNNGQVLGEQSIWFDGIFTENSYQEMKVTVNSITNGDASPKFGLSLKSNGNHVFFYIDVGENLLGTNIGIMQRIPTIIDGQPASGAWDFEMPYGVEGLSFSYTNGNYVKLGLLKSQGDIYLFINDQLVNSVSGLQSTFGQSAVGLTVFNLNVTIKDYSVSSDIFGLIDFLNFSECAKHNYNASTSTTGFFFNITTAPCNSDVGNELSAWIDGSYSRFYYEFDICLTGVLNNDPYPKAGIAIEDLNVGTLLFYIDSVNLGNFGSNQVVGCVFRSINGSWDWDNKIEVSVPNLKYTPDLSGKEQYAKLAVYKEGANYVLLVNDTQVLSVQKSEMANAVIPGLMEFNLAFLCFNTKVATSNLILNKIVSVKSINI